MHHDVIANYTVGSEIKLLTKNIFIAENLMIDHYEELKELKDQNAALLRLIDIFWKYK